MKHNIQVEDFLIYMLMVILKQLKINNNESIEEKIGLD
jgi:hypothetical protein